MSCCKIRQLSGAHARSTASVRCGDFGAVHAGDVGGYIECERNLSQDDNAWVSDNALVCGDACVYGNTDG